MVKKDTKKESKIRDRLISISFIVIALLLLDQTMLGGNTRFYTKWVKCGHQPVQTQAMPGIAWYEKTNPYPATLRNTSLYCTPIEAERAGYSASQNNWDFPNLVKAGEPLPFSK